MAYHNYSKYCNFDTMSVEGLKYKGFFFLIRQLCFFPLKNVKYTYLIISDFICLISMHGLYLSVQKMQSILPVVNRQM